MFQQQEKERRKRRKLNPVWRGVGCLLVVVFGSLAWYFSGWFLIANAANRWVFLPREAMNPPGLPDFFSGGMLVRIVLTVLALILSFTIVNFGYAVMFPLRPGETDVPPLKRDRRKRPTRR
jgi:hypothetical protein